MTRLTDTMRDIRHTNDKARGGDCRMIGIVGHVMVPAVFPGNLIVKLLDVAYVTDVSCNMFLLMAEHRHGVEFRKQEGGICVSPFDV